MNKSRLPGFTHLHVHSYYTLLGGTASIEELVGRAIQDGFSHLALTDTNVLYGAVTFDRACRAAGLQPILGMTVTVAPLPGRLGPANRLVLLARNPAGYRTLCRLSSLMQGTPERKVRASQGLDWEELKSHTEGLICLSGGKTGGVMQALARADEKGALRYAGRLAGLYGEANTYLSLEIHRLSDLAIAKQIIVLGARLGLPTLAVQPVYYLHPKEHTHLRLLAAIDHNVRLDQVPANALPHEGVHWLSPDEMRERFDSLPNALANVATVVERCGDCLPDGQPIWPVPSLTGQSAEEVLAEQAAAGLEAKYRVDPDARSRLDTELTAITRHGFTPLFLVVADIVRFARHSDIPVSTRGSVANSLVAYCLDITTVDPIAHDLLFERFLNPARADPPDIDLDVCSRRRDEVLEYVRRTYGEERVALVGTVSTLQPKSAVRETAKAYGLSEEEISPLVARLPRRWHPDPRRRDRRTPQDLLNELEDSRLREIVSAAYSLVGTPHHLSVHPGGLTITPGPLTDWVPLQWAPKGFLITQYDHHGVESMGLAKIDLLGIRALTVLAETVALVNRHQPDFRLTDMHLDDPATADLLERGETIGVFQCESAGAQRTLR